VLAVCCLLAGGRALGEGGTVHNFPLAGVEGSSRGACSYCHVTHAASAGPPALWDPELSNTVYKVYESSTLQAQVGQPSGSAKVCLSCHDGTLAPGAMGPGGTTLPAAIREMLQGELALGTDLSDDHPVSFKYDAALSSNDPGIRHPGGLQSTAVKLDKNGMVQCTTCHDPHIDTAEGFLVMNNRASALCVSCHQVSGWADSVHATSTATASGANPWHTEWTNVADNACGNCHTPHHAGSARLLVHQDEEQNCLACHDGNVAEKDIASEMRKPSAHRADLYRGVHDPLENPLSAPMHVECHDCHNPHAARLEHGANLPGSLEAVRGVNTAGAVVATATAEYEICYKCHADNPSRPESTISRQIEQTNVRMEFNDQNPSFHPVGQPGASDNVPSLIAPLAEDSVITCTDCHASDNAAIRGPHGSAFAPLLVRNYSTADYTNESASAYALCYGCHSRDVLYSDSSFKDHEKHVRSKSTPCSACHDPHGISYTQGTSTNHGRLINFDTSIVLPYQGRIEYEHDSMTGTNRCWLTCHGEEHNGGDDD